MPRIALRQHLTRLVSFALGSGLGLLVDLGGFTALTTLRVLPAAANVLSSSLSLVVVYVFVTRRTFGARIHPATFLCFAAWYAANIAATSMAIQLLVDHLAPIPTIWKLALVPVSFGANFLFNVALHRAAAALLPRTPPPDSSERPRETAPVRKAREIAQ